MSFTQEIQPQVSMQLLAPDHHHTLVQAIQNVLSTEVAEITMAQLIDGLPLMSTAWNMRGNLLLRSHPLSSHETLCEGVVEQAKAFRSAFDPAILSFDVSVPLPVFCVSIEYSQADFLSDHPSLPRCHTRVSSVRTTSCGDLGLFNPSDWGDTFQIRAQTTCWRY